MAAARPLSRRKGVSIEVQRRAVGRAAESSAGRISAPPVPRSQALEWMSTWRTCGRRWRCPPLEDQYLPGQYQRLVEAGELPDESVDWDQLLEDDEEE
jgi:hypothetical protein